MVITIKATYDEPSKKSLWLVKVIGVNKEKFCGKSGNVLKSEEQNLMRAELEVGNRTYCIASVDDVKDNKCNFKFERLKKFDVSADDISYQFSFGWDNEIYAKTLKELENKIIERLNACKKHIEKSKNAEQAITKLLDEFNSHTGEGAIHG